MDQTPQYSGEYHPSSSFNLLKSSLEYRKKNVKKSNDVSSIAEGKSNNPEIHSKTADHELNRMKNYFQKNPFTASSEVHTVPEPAKNPYDENTILTEGENPPDSDDYLDLLLRYQQDIEHMVKNGTHPRDIVDSGKGIFVDTKKNATIKDNPITFSKNTIVNFQNLESEVSRKYRGISIRDIVSIGTNPEATNKQREEINQDLNVLAVMGAFSLKNAFKLSDEQLPGLAIQIKEIYLDHARQGEIAEDMYGYYTLQRKKKERRCFLKDCCTKLYYTLALSEKRKNRRYKKDLALILEKEKERRQHLVERYPKSVKNKRGKRGREKGMLDDLIKIKEDYKRQIKDNLTNNAKAVLPYDRILREMEEVFGKCRAKAYESHDPNVQLRFEIAKDSFQSFKDRVVQEGLAQAQYLTVNSQMDIIREIKDSNAKLVKRIEKVIKKYGCPSWRSWVNDISSDGGAALEIVITALDIAKIAL